MYKFLGKKGKLYDIEKDEVIMKLNYKCPKDKYGEGFSCGKTKEEARKNFETEQKLKAEKQKGVDERRGKRAEKVSSKAEKRIAKITDPMLLEKATAVKSLIEKARNELAAGKVSKETYKELKNSVNELRSLVGTSSSKPSIEKVPTNKTKESTQVDNNYDIISSMKPGEIWNAGLVGDIKVESIKGNNITVTANGKTETMTKGTLQKALKEFKIVKKSDISSKTSSKNIDKIVSKLNEISQITDPIERQQFISENPKLKQLEKYQKIKEKEKNSVIKDLKNKIKEMRKNEKDPDVAEKKELEILDKLEPLQGEYKNIPIEKWEDSTILEYYSSEHYATVNKSLDTKERPKKCVEYTNKLSSIIKSNKVDSDVTTFRGISDSAYEKLVSNGMRVGSEIECPRFTSTSKNIAVAYDFAVSNQKNKDSKINIIKCDIPKGTSAMDMTKHVNNAYYEEEVLLNAGQKFKIENIEENDKYRIIHWKVV